MTTLEALKEAYHFINRGANLFSMQERIELEDRLKRVIDNPSHLKKICVCASCLSPSILYNDCVCTYQNNYPTVELEFEVCGCCGNHLDYYADTDFNKNQLDNLKR